MRRTSQIDWHITDVQLISPPRPVQANPPSNVIHHSFFSLSLSICLYRSERVRGVEQDSCQTCPQWVKMAGEVLSCFFPPPLSCSLGSKLKPAPPPHCLFPQVLWCYFVWTKGKTGRSKLSSLSVLWSGWLMPLPTSGMTMKGPFMVTDPWYPPDGIYIPCLCATASHMLHFLSLLTYTDPIFKVRACTKATKQGFFLFCFALVTNVPVYLDLSNLSKIAENIRPRINKEGGKKKKKSVKINSVLPHSFSDKQHLHRMGNKYYLCNRKTIRHR